LHCRHRKQRQGTFIEAATGTGRRGAPPEGALRTVIHLGQHRLRPMGSWGNSGGSRYSDRDLVARPGALPRSNRRGPANVIVAHPDVRARGHGSTPGRGHGSERPQRTRLLVLERDDPAFSAARQAGQLVETHATFQLFVFSIGRLRGALAFYTRCGLGAGPWKDLKRSGLMGRHDSQLRASAVAEIIADVALSRAGASVSVRRGTIYGRARHMRGYTLIHCLDDGRTRKGTTPLSTAWPGVRPTRPGTVSSDNPAFWGRTTLGKLRTVISLQWPMGMDLQSVRQSRSGTTVTNVALNVVVIRSSSHFR